MDRKELREGAGTRAGWRCQWPCCGQRGQELAHCHSIGMGGRPSADTLENVVFLCRDHARISDGERGSGGGTQYLDAMFHLLGARYLDMMPSQIGYERAEALRSLNE